MNMNALGRIYTQVSTHQNVYFWVSQSKNVQVHDFVLRIYHILHFISFRFVVFSSYVHQYSKNHKHQRLMQKKLVITCNVYFCIVQFGCHKVHNTHKSSKFVCLPNLNQGSRLPDDKYRNSLLYGIRFVVVAFFIFIDLQNRQEFFCNEKKVQNFDLIFIFLAYYGRLEGVLGWLTVNSMGKTLYRILLFCAWMRASCTSTGESTICIPRC